MKHAELEHLLDQFADQRGAVTSAHWMNAAPQGVGGTSRAAVGPDVVGTFEGMSRLKFLPAVVRGYADRLRIDTLRDDASMSTDWELTRIFNQAMVRADLHSVFSDAFAVGHGFLSVLPHPRKPGQITTRRLAPEDAFVMPWEDDSAEAKAAVVVSRLDATHLVAHVYDMSSGKLEVTRYVSPERAYPPSLDVRSILGWEPTGAPAVPDLPGIPIFAFGDGDPIVASARTALQQAHTSIFHRLILEDRQSFRKLLILGATLERDADGNPKDPGVTLSPDSISYLPPNDEGDKPSAFESSVTDGSSLTSNVNHALGMMCALAGYPQHYLLPMSAASVSPTVLEVAENVFRARLHTIADQFGEVLGHALTLMRSAAGLAPASNSVVWQLNLPTNPATAGDTFVKFTTGGMPLREALERSGAATPSDAETMAGQATSEALLAALTAETAPTQAGTP